MQGQLIDQKYEVTGLLGEGGMGAVYAARHVGTGRRVAVKVITGEGVASNAPMVARFQREARASGAIESQHIASVLDMGRDGSTGQPYLVMELLSGEDLGQAIERIGPLPHDLALRIVAQACIGLQKAHEAGIVHRDIKPANLFLSRQDAGAVVVKLLDFGIAKVKMDQLSSAEHHALTRTGSMLGSPLYMSPEQAKGAKNVDHRTDLWSLGVVLYEALCGSTPHGHADTLGSLILAICSEPPRPVQEVAPWVPPEVAAIVHRALTPDREGRYASAAEMLAACRALLREGVAITDSMLVAVTAQTRAVIAPRIVVTGAAAAPVSVPQVSAVALANTVATASGLAQSVGPSQRRSRRTVAWIAGAAFLLAAGGVAYRYRPRQQGIVAASPAVTSAPTAAPPPPAADPSAAAATRRVTIAIVPAGAAVQVDGAPAAVVDGKVTLEGALGSVHDVALASGKAHTSAEVAITESGAVPSHLALPDVPGESAQPRAPAVPRAVAGRGGTPPPKPKPPATAAPQSTTLVPTVGVDTAFR